MEAIYIVGPRLPESSSGYITEVPEDYIIVNAPRPLYGEIQWCGDFLSGVFYAAYSPEDTYSHSRNEELDAKELIYISAEEFKRRVNEWSGPYAKKMGIDLARFDFATIARSFANLSKDRYLIRSEVPCD